MLILGLLAGVLAVTGLGGGLIWWHERYSPVPLDTDPAGRGQARDLARSLAAAGGGCEFMGFGILGFSASRT